MTQNDQYVTGIALSQFVYGAQSLGIDSHHIINQAGLSQEHLKPSARVPGQKYEMALLKLILAHKNGRFGVDIGQQIIPPLYGVLMSLALNSNSLGEALGYFARYQAIATGNCGEVEYSLDGQNYIRDSNDASKSVNTAPCFRMRYDHVLQPATANCRSSGFGSN